MAVVETEDRGAVRVLWMNRPERRNALSNELIDAIAAGLAAAAADPTVHAVVLAGRGRVFCAGGDLAGGLGGDGFLDGHAARGRYAALLEAIPRLRVPVVAAVQGDALGGGLGLVAACDLAIVDPAASLGTPEIRVGLFPMIILAALQRCVPRKALLELVLTGGRVDAARAEVLGLVNRVSAPGAALDEALVLAGTLAERSPAILALGKSAFYRVADMDYEDALAYLSTQLTLNLLTEDAAEGLAAFLEKRAPVWKGR